MLPHGPTVGPLLPPSSLSVVQPGLLLRCCWASTWPAPTRTSCASFWQTWRGIRRQWGRWAAAAAMWASAAAVGEGCCCLLSTNGRQTELAACLGVTLSVRDSDVKRCVAAWRAARAQVGAESGHPPKLLSVLKATSAMDNPVAVSRRTPGPAGALSIAARRCAAHPKKSLAAVLWLLGLWIAFLAKPNKLTKEQLSAFHAKVAEASGRRRRHWLDACIPPPRPPLTSLCVVLITLLQSEGLLMELTRVENRLMDAQLDTRRHQVGRWRVDVVNCR